MREYFDADGNPITLMSLIKFEPEWAESQIRERDKMEHDIEVKDLTVMRFHKDSHYLADKVGRLSDTLDDFARQNLVCEMEPEDRDGDYEGAYEIMIRAARKALKEANTSPRPIEPKEGEICQECGKKYTMIYWAPDEVWETIKPDAKTGGDLGGGLLCLPCADSRARSHGIVLRWQASTGWWLPTPAPDVLDREAPHPMDKYFGMLCEYRQHVNEPWRCVSNLSEIDSDEITVEYIDDVGNPWKYCRPHSTSVELLELWEYKLSMEAVKALDKTDHTPTV